MEQQSFEWTPLISDPEIFNTVFHSLGLSNSYRFEELFSFEENYLPQESNTLALILNSEKLKNLNNDFIIKNYPELFYMKQDDTLTNACGIVAGLHAIGNINLDSFKHNNHSLLKEDSFLKIFYSKNYTPEENCKAIFESEQNRTINKSLKSDSSIEYSVKHHYTAFIKTKDNDVLELDGRQINPILVASNIQPSNFLKVIIQEINNRLLNNEISEYLSLIYLTSLNN